MALDEVDLIDLVTALFGDALPEAFEVEGAPAERHGSWEWTGRRSSGEAVRYAILAITPHRRLDESSRVDGPGVVEIWAAAQTADGRAARQAMYRESTESLVATVGSQEFLSVLADGLRAAVGSSHELASQAARGGARQGPATVRPRYDVSREILDALEQHDGELSTTDIARLTGADTGAVFATLLELQELGMVKGRGDGRSTRWFRQPPASLAS